MVFTYRTHRSTPPLRRGPRWDPGWYTASCSCDQPACTWDYLVVLISKRVAVGYAFACLVIVVVFSAQDAVAGRAVARFTYGVYALRISRAQVISSVYRRRQVALMYGRETESSDWIRRRCVTLMY